MNLRRQIIEHGDFVSFVGELERDVRAEKPAPPVIRMFFIGIFIFDDDQVASDRSIGISGKNDTSV